MLSLDLFNSRYEKRLHEGAVDDAEYARLKTLGQKIDYLKQARAQIKDANMRRVIDGRIKEYDDERIEILSVRGMKESEQTAQPQTQQTKGIGDTQDPKQKMAQLQQRSKKGPLANVAAGIKAFVKGEPEPMGEEQQLGRRGIGMANMKALQSTVEKGFARTVFQFSSGKYVVGEDDTDKMADYYNALDSAGRTNFVYNVLGDGAKFIQMSRELGIQATPVEPQQPELPGMPQASPQRELPLSEKKKSNSDDLEAGDIKVARELQKLRAEYPAARSDIEAVARAEIDSTERSQRQLSAIRGANEKQDALLKQLVALDQEQGREISGLDKENNSLEKQLDQVQRTNAALAQTVSQMTGTKKSARPAPQTTAAQSTDNVINLIPGAPADQQKVEPQRKPLAQPVLPTATAKQDTDSAPELTPNLGPISQVAKFAPPERLIKPQKAAESKIKEHGGGIGPRQHWQDLMPETVTNIRAGMAEIYRRLAPKIERHRDSFLAGQLYDELENYAELHGAEGEFKRMMNGARNRAHMEYDTNPGGFQNWFWFLPFEDEQLDEISRRDFLKGAGATAGAAALGAPKGAQAQNAPRDAVTYKPSGTEGDDWVKNPQHPDGWIRKSEYDRLYGNKKTQPQQMNMEEGRRYAVQQSIEILRSYFSVLAGAQGSRIRDYVTNKIGQLTVTYATDTNNYNLKNVVDYGLSAGKSAADDIKFVPFLTPADEVSVNITNAFVSAYQAAIVQKVREFNQLAQQQRQEQNIRGGFSQLEFDVILDALIIYAICKDNQLENSNIFKAVQNSIRKLVDATNSRNQINELYKKAMQSVEMLKSNPQQYQKEQEQFFRNAGVIIQKLDKITTSKKPEFEESVNEAADDIKKRMSKLEALALAANRAGDDAKCKMYQQKIQSLKQKLSQSMSESLKPGEYHIHTVYFKDGTKKRIRVTSDEFDVVGYYKQRGQAVDRVDYDYQIHSDMSEQFATPGTTIPRKSVIQGYTVFFNPKTQVVSVTRGGDSEEAAIEQARVGTPSLKNFRQAADRLIDRIESDLNEAKEILTKNDFLDARDYLLRKIDADSNPANKQIIKAEIRKLESQAEAEGWITMQQRMVREDSDGGEAVEMAIMRRMLVAHTDLIVEHGLDKVVAAIEEVAYNVGDVDEIGSSDVSGWVRQVKQILGAEA